MSKFAFNPTLEHVGTFHGSAVMHNYNIKQGDKDVGIVNVGIRHDNPKDLHVYDVQSHERENSFGPGVVKNIARQLKKHHPEVETISGRRVSGARGKGDEFTAPTVRVKLR